MATKLLSQLLKGTYSGATAYTVGDIVDYSGSSYACKANTTGNLPTNTTYWALLASKGDTGATGATGATGDTGATGATGTSFTWLGAYNAGTSYVANDNVSYNGSSYICILASTGNLPTNATYWSLLAQKGTDGTGSGDVLGPATNTDSYIPQWNGADSKTLKNGIPTSTFAPALGADDNYVTDAQLVVIGNTSGTNTGDSATPAETATTIGALIGGAGDATPNDTDFVATSLTAAGILKKITWTNVKAFLKTYFDTLYARVLSGTDYIKLGSAITDKCEIRLNDSALNDETWSGTVLDAVAGATLAVGDVCYLKTADGQWYLNDGILDGTDAGFKLKLGICVLAANDNGATKMLLDGLIASAAFPTFTVGAPVYLDDTAGDLVVAQPSTTNFAIRVVGEAVSATVLHFHPSNDYIVHV